MRRSALFPAAGFEDGELHVKLRDLVAEDVIDASEDRWTDPSTVLIESMLIFLSPSQSDGRLYGTVHGRYDDNPAPRGVKSQESSPIKWTEGSVLWGSKLNRATARALS